MLLAALLDCGAPLEPVRRAVAACGGEQARIEVREVTRAGLRGLQLSVDAPTAEPRRLESCREAVAAAGLPERLRRRALAALRALADTESRLHAMPAGRLELHELGNLDTLVDVVGVCAALEELDVGEVWCSPLPAAFGSIPSEHGRLPLPAPATMAMLAAAHAPLLPAPDGVEHVTPTAAALVTTLARFGVPPMRLRAVGHGAGSRDAPDRPNLVRVWLGEAAGSAAESGGFADLCVELRTNLDDVSPAVVADLAARCLERGALDAWIVPATMKKGRPGHVLHVLAPPGQDAALAAFLLEQSPTLGVRRSETARMVAGRDLRAFDSPLGRVRVKCKLLAGRVVDARPEIDDCRRLAGETGRPLHEVLDTVTAAARAALVEAEP